MKGSNTSPLSIAALAFAYLAGVVSVAVLCCDDVILPGETPYANASPPPPASASEMDGGDEGQLPVLSDVAFVFREGIDGIAGVTASVVLTDGSKQELENIRLYRKDGVLVVETQAEFNKNLRPHFYFMSREGQVVEQYLANVFVNHSLMTYDYQHFGDNEQTPYYHQPDEIQVDVGETAEITLETKNRFWVDGQFVDLWQIVHLPTEAQPSASSNCQLLDLGMPPKSVGIISDGTSGEIVTLEVLP